MKLTKYDLIFPRSSELESEEMFCADAAKKFNITHGRLAFYCRSGQITAKRKMVNGQPRWVVNLESLRNKLKGEQHADIN